jgi:hypothetical protein
MTEEIKKQAYEGQNYFRIKILVVTNVRICIVTKNDLLKMNSENNKKIQNSSSHAGT